MKIAYFDTISGIAGDMTMAAFVSAGLPLDELSSELQKASRPMPIGVTHPIPVIATRRGGD